MGISRVGGEVLHEPAHDAAMQCIVGQRLFAFEFADRRPPGRQEIHDRTGLRAVFRRRSMDVSLLAHVIIGSSILDSLGLSLAAVDVVLIDLLSHRSLPGRGTRLRLEVGACRGLGATKQSLAVTGIQLVTGSRHRVYVGVSCAGAR
jgi:hypothetical protein